MSTRDEYLPPYTHPITAQLIDASGVAVGTAHEYPAGSRVGLRISTVDDRPPVQPGDWDGAVYKPDDFENVEELDSGLATFLQRYDGDRGALMVIVSDDAVLELEDMLWRGGTDQVWGCTVSAKSNEFREHVLRMRTTKTREDISLQGFSFTNPGGYGAKINGTGHFEFANCEFYGGVKGIAVSGSDAKAEVVALSCRFRDIREGVSAGIYNVRGTTTADECVFERIGMLNETSRSPDSLLKHGIYNQWDATGHVTNCYFRDMDSHAVQLRGGGHFVNSAAVETANGVLIGHDKDSRPNVTGSVDRCIITDTEDVSGRTNTGVALWAERAQVSVKDTYILNERSRGMGAAIRPQSRSDVVCENVHVQAVDRVLDIDGTGVRVRGRINYVPPVQTVVNYRPGSDGVVADGTMVPVMAKQLPDFRTMPAPVPGKVAEWMDNARGMIR